jgi:hypothetical protein
MIEWVLVQLSIEGKHCLDPIHPLSLWKVEFLLSSYIVYQQLQVDEKVPLRLEREIPVAEDLSALLTLSWMG